MTEVLNDTEADRLLKAKHRAMWALGDYPGLAVDVIADLGPILVAETGIKAGDRVLDIAAGAGNASIPAALLGADVLATDLTPELMEAGKLQAINRGAELQWQQADAEALPLRDNEFDAVISCVGVMFAPHHQVAADELVRVCAPGGRIGLLSWTPEGFIGQMFAAMKPFAPPPPPGAQPPPLWGSENHIRSLFGDRVNSLRAHRHTLRTKHFSSADDFRDYFKAKYGPTIAVYRFIAGDPEKVAALDAVLAELGRRHSVGSTGDGPFTMEWEYLLVTAEKN